MRFGNTVRFILLPITFAMVCIGCGLKSDTASNSPRSGSEAEMESCQFDSAPTVVRSLDDAVLQYWEVEDRALWFEPVLPTDSAYAAYRQQVEALGADQAQPEQYVPEGEQDNEGWRRELHNVAQAYGGAAGTVRPIACLEAVLFAYQNARYPQLDHPTEFLALVLRNQVEERHVLRVYFGAGDEMFPPKTVYGFDEVERDVAAGWTYVAMLHNHTIQDADGEARLGVPAPSVSDVQLLHGLVENYGLERVWVTNGFYTLDMPTDKLDRYLGPE